MNKVKPRHGQSLPEYRVEFTNQNSGQGYDKQQ